MRVVAGVATESSRDVAACVAGNVAFGVQAVRSEPIHHSVLSENLLPNPADEGRLRQHVVEIGKSVYRPPSVPAQIDEMLDEVLDKASRIDDPFEQSFFAMVDLPYLQPFADVDKRTSRLAANLPLIRANLCPLTFLDVPERAYTLCSACTS